MPKFLIPLLAAFALPTAVNAETWWLVVGARFAWSKPAATSWQIPTSSFEQCKESGEKIIGNEGLHGKVFDHVRYRCVLGK